MNPAIEQSSPASGYGPSLSLFIDPWKISGEEGPAGPGIHDIVTAGTTVHSEGLSQKTLPGLCGSGKRRSPLSGNLVGKNDIIDFRVK